MYVYYWRRAKMTHILQPILLYCILSMKGPLTLPSWVQIRIPEKAHKHLEWSYVCILQNVNSFQKESIQKHKHISAHSLSQHLTSDTKPSWSWYRVHGKLEDIHKLFPSLSHWLWCVWPPSLAKLVTADKLPAAVSLTYRERKQKLQALLATILAHLRLFS